MAENEQNRVTITETWIKRTGETEERGVRWIEHKDGTQEVIELLEGPCPYVRIDGVDSSNAS